MVISFICITKRIYVAGLLSCWRKKILQVVFRSNWNTAENINPNKETFIPNLQWNYIKEIVISGACSFTVYTDK
jgi:hypothetical protein